MKFIQESNKISNNFIMNFPQHNNHKQFIIQFLKQYLLLNRIIKT
jgi:hypothetical protein